MVSSFEISVGLVDSWVMNFLRRFEPIVFAGSSDFPLHVWRRGLRQEREEEGGTEEFGRGLICNYSVVLS